MMKALRVLFLVFGVCFLLFLLVGAAYLLIMPKAAAIQTTPFDHMQCQYPTRATNPLDGCDNSDPACPAEIKGGSCPKVDLTSTNTVPAAPAASQAAKTPMCESCCEDSAN